MNRFTFNKNIVLTRNSSVEQTGAAIDRVRAGEHSKNVLVELLSERHPVYEERPGYQATLIKGYAMASFENVGLPGSALNFVLDELQNGKNAYMVAAAARGLRGAKSPATQYVKFLLQALANMRYHDDSMSLDEFKPSWPLKNPTTAKKEIFISFQWLQGYAKGALPELNSFLKNNYDFDPGTREEIRKAIDMIETDDRKLDLACCEIEGEKRSGFSLLWTGVSNIKSLEHLEVENEKGICRPLKEFIDQRPAVVAFFYTRCMNPNKCTLTINKLGWLQQELLKYQLQEKVNILAFTYDPGYDTPARMHVFGENRGIVFGPNAHMLRTGPEEFSLLSGFFRLGVNHVNATVNQHRLELFLLDKKGNISTSYTRLQWEIDKVFRDIKRLVKSSSRSGWLSSIMNCFQQVLFPIALALFPKCPVCWAVYLSAFGISGIQSIPYSPWLIPWLIVAISANLIIIYRKARFRNGLIPFWISLAGGILVIGPGYLFSNITSAMSGVSLIMVSAILNSLPYSLWLKLNHFVSSVFRDVKKPSQTGISVFRGE